MALGTKHSEKLKSSGSFTAVKFRSLKEQNRGILKWFNENRFSSINLKIK